MTMKHATGQVKTDGQGAKNIGQRQKGWDLSLTVYVILGVLSLLEPLFYHL